jgi:hypothetical protein
MTRAGDVRIAPLLYALKGACLAGGLVMPAIGRADQLPELVFQPFLAKVVLLDGNPFLKAEVRLDHESGHPCPPCAEIGPV